MDVFGWTPLKVPPDRELELTVVMCYDNEPMKFVHAPRPGGSWPYLAAQRFPKKKTYSWWCILGDTEAARRLRLLKRLKSLQQGLVR